MAQGESLGVGLTSLLSYDFKAFDILKMSKNDALDEMRRR